MAQLQRKSMEFLHWQFSCPELKLASLLFDDQPSSFVLEIETHSILDYNLNYYIVQFGENVRSWLCN